MCPISALVLENVKINYKDLCVDNSASDMWIERFDVSKPGSFVFL